MNIMIAVERQMTIDDMFFVRGAEKDAWTMGTANTGEITERIESILRR